MKRFLAILAVAALSVGCRHRATLDGHTLTATSHMQATCEELADGTKNWTIDTTETTVWDSLKAGATRVVDAIGGMAGRTGVTAK